MEKADVYRDRAEECRVIASQMRPGDQRSQLLEIASQWDQMAVDREALFRKFPDMAENGAPPSA